MTAPAKIPPFVVDVPGSGWTVWGNETDKFAGAA